MKLNHVTPIVTELRRSMYFYRRRGLPTPDGHEFRLYHAGRNRLDPPWKLRGGELPDRGFGQRFAQ